MEVILNNEKIVTQAENLEQLILESLPDAGDIAVAVGTTVVRRCDWAATILNENDVVTVIRATRGG